MSGQRVPTTVVLDLGGVVLAWDPHRAFHGVLEPDDVQPFLDEVGFERWNHQPDAGTPSAAGVEELTARFPHHADAIAAFPRQHHLTVTGEVPGTRAVIDRLAAAGVRLLALTNWSAETFPWARRTFSVLDRFEAIVVSGDERLAKPDPALFTLLLRRHAVRPDDAVFVDDRQVNVDAATALGMRGVRFVDAATLASDLEGMGVLPADV